jgi:DNA ligase (NAD+)
VVGARRCHQHPKLERTSKDAEKKIGASYGQQKIGLQEKSAGQLHDALQDKKEPRLERFLYALGMRHVGQHVARVLAQKYGSLASLKRAGIKELQKTTEIGPEIARSVAQFFKEKENQRVMKEL